MGGEDGGRWVAGFFLKPGSPDGTHLRGVGDTPPPGPKKNRGQKRPAEKGVRIHGLRPDPTPPRPQKNSVGCGGVLWGGGRAWVQTGV